MCIGAMVGINQGNWSFRIDHFVIGDLGTLIKFIEQFDTVAISDRYILSASIGDGRVLESAPSVAMNDLAYTAQFPIKQAFPRIEAANLPRDIELTAAHDWALTPTGDLATVSGLASLPQKVKMCLSLQKGEILFHRDLGTRIAEYFALLCDLPWFEYLFKLEVIRQAAIPHIDDLSGQEFTPLQCVERVRNVEILAKTPVNQWLPIRVDFEVKGVGQWQSELSICVPQEAYQIGSDNN